MKVTFVYPDILYPHIPSWSGTFYTGIGYLAAVLKKAGHEVSLIHITHPVSEQAYVEMLGRGAPDLIAFSATTNMFPYVALWAQWSKQNLGVPTICGGIHPTLNPEETIDNSHIDMLCRGEGEEAIVELCGRLERGTTILDIEGLWVREGNTIHRNKPRRSLRDLDTLPFPDRTVFNHRSLAQSKEGIGIFMASRGCPYDCSYCCNHALRALQGQHGGPAVRFRSVDNVIAEVKTVLAEHPYLRIVHFDDDILPLSKTWFREFAEKFKREVGVPFRCNIRANLVDEESVALLKHAGCEMVALGIESGNEHLANTVLKRGISNERLIEAFALCKKAGMSTYAFNMVGLPHENMGMALETVKLNARVGSDSCQVSIFYPYMNTAIYEICRDEGFLTGKKLTSYFEDDSVLSMPSFRPGQIVFVKKYFTVLAKLYRLLFRLPRFLSVPSVMAVDRTLRSSIVARLLFPLANRAFNLLRRLKHAT